MSNEAIAKEAGHWYDQNGQPCYEVPNKSRPGTMRPTTLRDAKKNGYLPSVTSILTIIARPGLEVWKQNQILLSAATSPHNRSEMSADEWAAKVIADAQEQSKKAMDNGTAIHAAIEKYLRFGTVDEYEDFVVPVVQEMINRGMFGISGPFARIEHSFAHPMGYGGKIDFHSDTVLIDFKTKDFTDPGAKLAWDEHIYQLAAYRFGIGMDHLKCYNVFISTSKPGLIAFKEWTEEEVRWGFRVFMKALELWKMVKM